MENGAAVERRQPVVVEPDVPQRGSVAERAGRQVNQEVAGQVEPREARQSGERSRPDVRETVVGDAQVPELGQRREDVVREESDNIPRQGQAQQRPDRVERVRVDVAESVVV